MCGCCNSSKSTVLMGGAVVIIGGILAAHHSQSNKSKDASPAQRTIPAVPDDATTSTTSTVSHTSYQPEDDGSMGQMSTEDMMAFMVDWSKPVEEHQLLADLAGNWDTEAKFWMSPEEQPEVSNGKVSMKLVMGGRYLIEHYTNSTIMGMPFEGMGINGYDKAKHAYTAAWIDTFGTGIMTMTGTYDKEAKTLTWEGMAATPMGDVPTKHVQTFVDHDHMTLEFYDPDPAHEGELVRVGIITYTRSNEQ